LAGFAFGYFGKFGKSESTFWQVLPSGILASLARASQKFGKFVVQRAKQLALGVKGHLSVNASGACCLKMRSQLLSIVIRSCNACVWP
jgi:hypothetical protein